MSKPRYKWWPYVKNVIRDYPNLQRQYEELHTTSAVANYSGMTGGGGGRPLEALAIRELPSTSQREYEAVRRAVEATERYRNGKDRLRVIDMVLWKQSHTLEGAAMEVPCHYKTAQGWQKEFINLTARNLGLMD